MDDPLNAGLKEKENKDDDLDLDVILSELFTAILSDDDGMLNQIMDQLGLTEDEVLEMVETYTNEALKNMMNEDYTELN